MTKVTKMTKDSPTGRDFLGRKMFCCNSFIQPHTQSPHPNEQFTFKLAVRHCLRNTLLKFVAQQFGHVRTQGPRRCCHMEDAVGLSHRAQGNA